MPISNPVSNYGHTDKEFTYEGGKLLWNFCPADNNLVSHYMGCNVVFFADDHKHALDVLLRMFKWYKKHCLRKNSSNWIDKHVPDFLAALDDGIVKCTPAPMNQFYKVGWAANDTI